MENYQIIKTLEQDVRGTIITIETDNYHDARLNWNPYTSHYPSYIFYPECEEDIIQCISWCVKNKIRFRIRGNYSHSLGCDFSSVTNGFVCNVKNLNTLKYESSSNQITVGAGNTIGELVYGLAENGFMFPFGD